MPKTASTTQADQKGITLKKLRVSLGKTLSEVESHKFPKATHASLTYHTGAVTGWATEAEKERDHHISTIRAHIEALGGELEIFARIGKKRVKLAL